MRWGRTGTCQNKRSRHLRWSHVWRLLRLQRTGWFNWLATRNCHRMDCKFWRTFSLTMVPPWLSIEMRSFRKPGRCAWCRIVNHTRKDLEQRKASAYAESLELNFVGVLWTAVLPRSDFWLFRVFNFQYASDLVFHTLQYPANVTFDGLFSRIALVWKSLHAYLAAKLPTRQLRKRKVATCSLWGTALAAWCCSPLQGAQVWCARFARLLDFWTVRRNWNPQIWSFWTKRRLWDSIDP